MNLLPQSDESVRDEILEHLNKKYNKEFVAIALERGYSDILHCYVQGGDPDDDNVHAQRIMQNNTSEYNDTYFGIIIREEIEAEIMSLCTNINIPMQVFYLSNSLYYDNMFDSTKNYADLKQWIANGNPWRFTITIVLPLDVANNENIYASQIFEILAATGFKGLVNICILPNEGFVKVTRTTLNDILRQYDGQTSLFSESIN